MSLLLLVMLACACAGSYGLYKEVCHGSDLTISLDETPILSFRRGWFFLPMKPGSSRIPISDQIRVSTENGTALDPRFEISSDKFIIRHVTERDEGYFSYESMILVHLFRVTVKDCSTKVKTEFGSEYYFYCPSEAYSLEYTPLENTYGSQSQVLWNRTNPHVSEAGGRGRMRNNKWMMNKITYEHAGYYTLRDKNHHLIDRRIIMGGQQETPIKQIAQYLQPVSKWIHEATYQYFQDKIQGQHLDITLGVDAVLFSMTFKPAHAVHQVLLMKAGELQVHDTGTFEGRIQSLDGPWTHITIEDLQPSDSGTFEFTDRKGNLALVVYVEVKERYPYVRYVVSAVGVLVVVFCWCYVRKHCCKRTAGKTRSVPDTEAAPIYHHDLQDNTQPSTSASARPSASHGPTYSYPLYHNEPGPTSQPPLVPGPEDPHMSSSQPEAGTTAPMYDSLFSSDAEPQFELKGTAFPSAPPLSSDTPYSDVYTSDKLNFL